MGVPANSKRLPASQHKHAQTTKIMAFLCALAASFLFPTTGLSNGFYYLPALPSSEWLFNSRCYLLQDGCASIDERHLWSSTATCVVEILASEMGVRPLDNPVPIRLEKNTHTHTQLPSSWGGRSRLRLGVGRFESHMFLEGFLRGMFFFGINPFEKMSFLSNDQILKQRNTVPSFNSANALSFDYDYSYKIVAHRYPELIRSSHTYSD